ncbi:MAG: cbiM2 [Clostridiales bacterium]|nr:cbiM2 [Clostridiales bacterium]
MHMSDALLSLAVGGTMTAISTGTIAYSVKQIKTFDLDEKKIPMMGVMGAFVFAAQMINFTIPITGSSGHIGGGVLLAALLGPFPALITLASVLLIQCLFFADGGLLALGANIFNMGVLVCLIAYPLIYRPLVKKVMTTKRITIASILSVIVGLQLGSFFVVLETFASGITKLPFIAFVSLMQPIHLAIGLIEGIITAGVLCYIFNTRREILDRSLQIAPIEKVSMKKTLAILIIATIFVGGVLSLYASSKPDGLEWSIERVTGTAEIESEKNIHFTIQKIQDKIAILPDYTFVEKDEIEEQLVGTSISGIVGGLLTMATAGTIGIVILIFKKIKKTADI